ncbi:MAG: rhomboid family intramembrane serine protease [Spirosomataceae bacterium]
MISITYLLIGVQVILSIMAFRDPTLKFRMIFSPSIIRHRQEYFRFLTSGFIHADYLHLFFNMWALFLFGQPVEEFLVSYYGFKGTYFFLLLFISGVVMANLPDYWLKRYQPSYLSLGASGGVSSVVFASILLSPLTKLIIFPIPVPMPAWVFAILYTAYSVYMERRQMDHVNHLAHVIGGIWGIVFMTLLEPALLPAFLQQIMSTF